MPAVVEVSPLLANLVWLAFLWVCWLVWLRVHRWRGRRPAERQPVGGGAARPVATQQGDGGAARPVATQQGDGGAARPVATQQGDGGAARPVEMLPADWVGASPEGARLLAMIPGPQNWIARREDRVEFADSGALWCVCRVSIWLDTMAMRELPAAGLRSVPVEFIPKGDAANVDICEFGEGRREVVSHEREHGLGVQSLATLAKVILGRDCSPATAWAIDAIVRSSAADAVAVLRAMTRRTDDPEAASLANELSFKFLAGAFATGELLIVDSWARGLTLSYRYRLSRSRRATRGLTASQGRSRRRRIGPLVRARLQRVPEVFGCRAQLYPLSCRGSFPGRDHVWELLLPALGREAVEIVTTYVVPPPSEPLGSFNANIAEGPLKLKLTGHTSPSDWQVVLRLAPRRGSDLLLGTGFVSLFVAGALAVGVIRPCAVAGNIEAMTVLLAIVPGLMIPLLWRGEHALVTFMFAGLRRTAAGVVAAGFCADAGLIGGLRGSALSATWALCFVVAFGGFVVAAWANLQHHGSFAGGSSAADDEGIN